MRPTTQASVLFIFITVLIDAIGIGIVIPVMPDLLRQFSTDVHWVATFYGYFLAIYALIQFFSSPVLGALSDRYGRRPVLLISLLGCAADYVLMAYAPSLAWLFFGRIISGLTGANYSVANAYMADISTDENRSINFGMIGAAFGFGFIVGPLIGGLMQQYGHAAPFLLAAGLAFLNFLFGWIVLPESLPQEKRRKLNFSAINPFSVLLKGISRKETQKYLWIYALISLAGHVHPSNWTLYTQTKFGWNATQVGWSLTFVGICLAFCQTWLTRFLIPKLGEVRSMWVGILIEALGFFCFAIAHQPWMMFVVTLFWATSAIGMPALQSIASRQVSESEQGELQGVLMSMMSLTSAVAPILYSFIFNSFPQFLGSAYFSAGLIGLVATFMAYQTRTEQSLK